MNNMPYPFMPDANMMNLPYQQNNIMELEQRVIRLERELHRLEKKVSNLEHKNPRPLISTPNNDSNDSSSMYMV